MNPSVKLCRTQEALHRGRAAATPLANVRLIAERAATAWAGEALSAERREARELGRADRARLVADRLSQDDHDRAFSENPDRGYAEPACAPALA